MRNYLTEEFYTAPAPVLAERLLGKLLCRSAEGDTLKMRITETECYFGIEDTACHAHKGRTQRTETMYLPGGHAYIYLCYGMHNLLNIVSGEAEHPEAVLIRGVEGFDGPGKLTKAMKIDRSLNGCCLYKAPAPLWLEDDGFVPHFERLPRVGIGYADREDRERLWRWRCV